MQKKKIIIISISILLLFVFSMIGGYFLYQKYYDQQIQEQNIALLNAQTKFYTLFTDKKANQVKLEVTKKEVDEVRKLFDEVKKDDTKKEYLNRLIKIEDFIKVRDQMRSYIVDGVMKSTTTDEDIKKLQSSYQKLILEDRQVLDPTMNLILYQRQTIKELESMIASFYDGNTIKDNIDAAYFSTLKIRVKKLPQKDLVTKYTEKINEIQTRLDELEAIKKAELEAERQAALAKALEESERLRKENAEIMANNVILNNVPRVNQKNGVLNGCEVASLLMGLQYKGYQQDMTLVDIAEAVPKTENPHTGFVLDIWGSLPLDRPHWIAPDALTTFGKNYYEGVTDISGASVEELKREIDNGNPVIVYGTYGFYNPRGWYGEVPINLHVMLMIGYNKRTGSIIINDPWGGVEIVVSGNAFAAQYNLMHYAVAIR